MIMAGVLERATNADSPLFIVKGGGALELRLRDRARATKDIDIVLRDTTADLADSLEEALIGEPYQGFSFRRKGQPLLLENGAVNMEFGVTYKGQPWTSVSVDIARAEAAARRSVLCRLASRSTRKCATSTSARTIGSTRRSWHLGSGRRPPCPAGSRRFRLLSFDF